MSDDATVLDQVTPASDHTAEPVVEPAAPVEGQTTPQVDETKDAHPLEPNGDRFKQVWARAKHAEADRDALRQEMQKERDARIRLEERLRAKEETKSAEQEYTWDQLEQAIEEGKITRAWANTYRENLIREKTRKETLAAVEETQTVKQRESSVESEIARYKQLVPEVLQAGSEPRQKVEREYAYMVNTLGFKPSIATELAATRAALGDLETVERMVKAKQSTTREPFMETHSSTQKPQGKSSRLIDKLDGRQKAHYEKMLRTGQYKNWDEIEEELKWTPPMGARRG